MGTRIASIWVRDDDKNPGQKKRIGVMKSDAGINLPAGSEIGVSVVRNPDKVEGDNRPDMFIEVWPMKKPADGGESDIPF